MAPTSPRPGVKNIKVLSIDRSMWLNGEWLDLHAGRSLLLSRSSGMMCCLGFCLKRLGLKDEEIMGIGAPHEIRALIPQPHREWLSITRNMNDVQDALVQILMDANDEVELTRKEREEVILKNFAAQGIKVRFIGRYPTKKMVEERIRAHGVDTR